LLGDRHPIRALADYGEIIADTLSSQTVLFLQTALADGGFLVLMVPLAGVELATFALRMRCSTN
jgi:hypothetical protein